MHNPYAGAAGIVLHIYGKFTMGKLKLLFLTSATCGAGTAYPSGASEFSSGFSGVPVAFLLVAM
jgi:hypothetical protein